MSGLYILYFFVFENARLIFENFRTVLAQYLISEYRGCRCSRKRTVKSPAVIESDDLIGESEKLCGDPAALAADDKKERFFEIGIKSGYGVADSCTNGFVTVSKYRRHLRDQP